MQRCQVQQSSFAYVPTEQINDFRAKDSNCLAFDQNASEL